jgi:Retrotransposon gag protein/Eukaryotic translation initiation factor 3 subunit G
MAQQMQQALLAHDRVRRSTELPLFLGFDKDNTITAHALMERIEHAANIANWDNPRKCNELFMILRKEAQQWWDSLRHVNALNPNEDWVQVKQRFLRTYAPRYTARTNCINLMKLYQGPNEKVQTFFLRLDETFKRMIETRPAELLQVRVPPLAENQNNNRDAQIKLEGLRDQDKFFLSQMFLAGLRESIRAKVMEEAPADLVDIVDLAIEKETIYLNEKNSAPTPSLFSIQESKEKEGVDEQTELSSEEREMILALRKKKNQTPFKRNGNGSPASSTVVCRYCKKTGHWQKQCRSRLRDKAPMLDENGKPYPNQGKVDGIQAPENDPLDFNKISTLGSNHLNY